MPEVKDLNIGYHIVKGKPVMKKVSYYMGTLEDKITYWISYCNQNNVTANYLKNEFKSICKPIKINNFRIRGKLNGEKRGGAYFGICMDTDKPVFGGGNLINAPIWWNTTKDFVQNICDGLMKSHPECKCEPELLN